MKNLTMIVHARVQQDMADLLRSIKKVQGFTFTRVEGHGAQAEHDPLLSARDKVMGYTPHMRVDILLEDADVDMVLDTIRMDRAHVSGPGIYWVTSVEQHGRL